MTSAGDPGSRAVVTPLRRPPVRQSVLVRAPLRHTFEAFVRTAVERTRVRCEKSRPV